MKKCPICSSVVPRTRKKSSKYCSDDCYDEAKRIRSAARYAALKGPDAKIKKNEAILATLMQMQLLNKPLYAFDLEKLGFDFGITTDEFIHEKKLVKAVGKYGYYIDANKNLLIWKLKSSQSA